MIRSWLRRYRRQRLLAMQLTPSETETLRRRVWHYGYLPDAQRVRVDQIVRVLLAEKQWVGAGVDVTSVMRVTIAGYAGLLVSGLPEPFFYDRLRTIVVRPRAFRYVHRNVGDNPHLPDEMRTGEAWHRGPVVVSWRAVERTLRSPDNVALHEFAHHLDGLVGSMDGRPYLGDRQRELRWYAVTEAEFLRLVGSAQRAEATLLDHYGATSRAEFFAVATECFFQQPHALRERHGALYETLADFYRQEPHRWMPRLEPQEYEAFAPGSSPRTRRRVPGAKRRDSGTGNARFGAQRDALRLRAYQSMDADDALYALALDRMEDGDWEDARRILSDLLRERPDDAEAMAQRSVALHALGEIDAAERDAEGALAIEPDEVDALLVRASVRAERGDLQAALDDLNGAVASSPRTVEPRFQRALVLIALGKHRRAIRDLNDAIAVDPYDADALAARGEAYGALGRQRQADADAQRAHLLDPDRYPPLP